VDGAVDPSGATRPTSIDGKVSAADFQVSCGADGPRRALLDCD
jgi:hypothetical protein